jgi:hypothetical protein
MAVAVAVEAATEAVAGRYRYPLKSRGCPD